MTVTPSYIVGCIMCILQKRLLIIASFNDFAFFLLGIILLLAYASLREGNQFQPTSLPSAMPSPWFRRTVLISSVM
ncbi:hypothetical protein MHIMP23_23400 [Methylobacterium hispanicum]